MSRPEPRGATRVIAIACLIFGMAWLAIAAPFFLRQLEVQRHWPRAHATLRSASVVEDSSAGGTVYKTHFEFNVELPSGPRSALVEGYRISSDRNKVKAEAARFHPGAMYLVRGNPRDPTDIRLDVDDPLRHFFLPILFSGVAAVFLAISAALTFFPQHSKHLARA